MRRRVVKVHNRGMKSAMRTRMMIIGDTKNTWIVRLVKHKSRNDREEMVFINKQFTALQ
jgi:hypothetical protein